MVHTLRERVLNKIEIFTTLSKQKTLSRFLLAKIAKWSWIIVRGVFIIGFCFTILYPVFLNIFKAFMPLSDAYDNSILFIPRSFTIDNFIAVSSVINYPEALKNTLTLSTIVTIFQTLSCLVVGYGFARFNFPLKKILFTMVIFTIIVPPQLLILPMFLHFKAFDIFGIIGLLGGKPLNLLDSYAPYFMLGLFAQGIRNGLFIFIFRQFFRGMPNEIEEAALVDGAGYFKTFYKIMLPNATTSIITVGLFSFVWQYNDLSYATTFLKNMKVLSTAYDGLDTSRGALNEFFLGRIWDPVLIGLLRSTAALLILIPVILIYVFAQKFFVQSVERAGIVG